jgi:PAS domain S-box-containing protein
MSLDMDATTVAEPQVRAWELLAHLADIGQDSGTLHDAQSFVRGAVDSIRSHLVCPWGLFLLHSIVDGSVQESWGLDDEQLQDLLARNGHRPPDETTEITLHHAGAPIGMLQLGSSREADAILTPSFLQALRGQLELLIALQQREAEHQRETATLQAAASLSVDLFGQTDLRAALRSISERAVTLSSAQGAAIWAATEDGYLELLICHGLSRDHTGMRLAPGQGLAGQIVLARTTLILDDYQEYAHRLPQFVDEAFRAYIGVPLLVQNELIGVLALMHSRPEARFTADDQAIIESFARPAALVLRNAQLFAQQQQRARELFVLYENGKVISSTLQIEPMLMRVAENITLAMGADRCALQLFDSNDLTILYEAASYSADGNGDSPGPRYRSDTYRAIVRLLQTGETLALDASHGKRHKDDADAVLRMFGYRSALLVALKVKDRTVGLLSVGYVEQRQNFSRVEINLAQTLANQVATAIVNAQLYAAEQQRSSELEKLQTISQQLGADLALDETLDAILECVRSLVPFIAAEICLYDSADQVLHVALVQGIREDSMPLAYQLTDGLTGWIARHRRTLRLADFRNPPVRPIARTLEDGSIAQSFLGLPLQLGDQLVGTLKLLGDRPNGFSAVDERLLTIVAGQAAQAIVNARRYEQADEHLRSRFQQLKALQRISRQLTATLYLHNILGFALEEALRATPATQGYIALRGYVALYESGEMKEADEALEGYIALREGDELKEADEARKGYIALREGDEDGQARVVAAAGYSDDGYTQLLNQEVSDHTTAAGDALARSEAVMIDELSDDDRLHGIGESAAAVLAVPIFYEEQVVGVVNLHSPIPRAFDHEALEFVRALADQTALAIGNAQRYEEQKRQRELLQQRAGLLNEVLSIGQALRADRSIEDVLEQIAFSIVETAGFRTVLFNLVDPDDHAVLRVITGAGLPLAEIERLRTGFFPIDLAQRFLDKQFRLGRCFFVPADAVSEIATGVNMNEFSLRSITDERASSEWQPDDMLFVPLYSTHAELIGLLSVDDPYDRQRPTRRSVEPLAIFADQAAIAIENVRLFRERERRITELDVINRIGSITSSTLDLEQMLNHIHDSLASFLTVDAFFGFVYDSGRNEVTRALLVDEGSRVFEHRSEPPAPGSMTEWIIMNRQPLMFADLRIEAPVRGFTPRFFGNEEEATASWLGVPLLVGEGEVVGVLSVQSYLPNRYGERELAFLTTVANQVALSVQNARLFTDRERQIAELDALGRISRVTSSTLELRPMAEGIYQVLHEILAADSINLTLFNRAHNLAYLLVIDHAEVILDAERELAPELETGTLAGWIVRNDTPLRIDDIEQALTTYAELQAMFVGDAGGLRSYLGIPLRAHDGMPIGALGASSRRAGAFSTPNERFLVNVGAQVSLAVQNVRLFAQAQEQVEQLSLLNRVSSAAAATLRISEIFYAALDAMVRATGADQARLVLFDHRAGVGAIAAEYIPTDVPGRISIPLVDNPSVDWLDAHQRPLVVFDAQHEPLFVRLHETFRDMDIRSIALIPLIVGESVIGSIGIDIVGKQRHFSEQDIELCQTIANQTATAIENARLFNEAQQSAGALQYKVGELSTLLESARVLSSSLKPREVLATLMEVVGRQLNVNSVALWTIEEDGVLLPSAMVGIEQDVVRTMRVPIGQGLTGYVAAAGQPLVVTDVEGHGGSIYPSFNRENQLVSFLGVPVVYHERIVGVLTAMTKQRREFSPDEVQLLAGMADQAAIALENAQLFEERERRIAALTTLNRIGQTINATLELDELLKALHRGISEVLDTSESFIALYDAATQILSFPIDWSNGQPEPQAQTVLVGSGAAPLSSKVILERQALLLRTPQDVLAIADQAPCGSWVGVPITQGENVLGIIAAHSAEPNAYDDDDLRFLTTVASQAATAIANARLFAERERRLREVSAIKDIGSAVTSTLDLQNVLERLHAELGRVIDVSTSSVGLYNAEQNVLTYTIAYDSGARVQFLPQRIDEGVNRWAIMHRQPLLIGTEEEYQAFDNVPRSDDGARSPERRGQSYLIVPIISGEDVLGVINIQSYEQHAFNQDDVRFVSTVANQAAVAINNARLFQERGRRIEELATFNEIGQQLSAVARLDELLDLIYRQTSRLLDTTNFYMAFYDERHDQITFPLLFDRGQRITVPPASAEDSLTSYVVRTREPLLLQGPDLAGQSLARDLRPLDTWSKSWLGVPMIAADHVIGVIGIQDYERDNAYSHDDARLLATIASWSAIAIDNARLLGETRQSVQELTALHEVTVVLAGTLDTAEIQEIVVSSTMELLKAEVCVVFLLDAQQQITHQIVLDASAPGDENRTLIISETGITRQIIASERPLVYSDITTVLDERSAAIRLGMRGLVGTVIGPHEQPLGVIWAGTRAPRDWQEREISLLAILANQASQALESARLFQSEQTRRAAADTLRETAQALTSVMALDDIMTLILDQLARLVSYDTASLLLRDGDAVRVAATRGFAEEQRPQIEELRFRLSDDSNMALIVQTRRPLVVEDAQMVQDFVPAEGTEHIHGWIGAPLLLDDEVIGLLCADSGKVGAYTEEDAQMAFALASQAAQAIRNARLFDEVRHFAAELEQRVIERTAALAEANVQLKDETERLQAVHAITLELTRSLDIEEILIKTLGLASHAVGVWRGSIMLRDTQTRELVCRAVLSTDRTVQPAHIPITFARGPGLSGWVMEHQEAIRIGDVRKDKRWLREEGRATDVRSVVAVPLLTQNETLGVLILTNSKIDYFSEAQLQLLKTIANEVAIVIHNAELYTFINDLATRLGEALGEQREESSKRQAILQSVNEGVIVLDERERVVLFNPAAEQVLGIPAEFALGQPLAHLREYGASNEQIRRAELIYTGLHEGLLAERDQGKAHVRMLELPTPAQTIALNFAPVVSSDGVPYGSVAVLRDVTREIEADRAKRDFISSVSHELRTPLTSIKGYVDLLLLGAAGPVSEGQLSFLGVVKNNANRLMDLINDILEIGRIDSHKITLNFEQIDIGHVFNDVLQTLRAEIDRKSIFVGTDVQDGLPEVTADPRRLTQVILNLVSNAVKYTYAEGHVWLRAFLNPSGMIQVDVEDNGVGISPEQQQHLFRRFYRADNPLRDEAGGTGLGLSIAKSFVELHSGEMWVKSEANKGSTFSFILPVTQPEQTDADEEADA